jgi:hypothetical protein
MLLVTLSDGHIQQKRRRSVIMVSHGSPYAVQEAKEGNHAKGPWSTSGMAD